MRFLVTGGNGMLGQAVCATFGKEHDVIAPGRDELDITSSADVQKWLNATRPGWVLHLAALTNVDQCQREPDLAFRTNTRATEQIAACCRELDAGLLFVSSIAVFSGEKDAPYVESDRPGPVNVYGQSKWQAEQAVATLSHHLIVRSGWLFGGGAVDKKFVGKILALAATHDSLAVVADKTGSPTSVDDLALGMKELLERGCTGLFHVVNAGAPATRYELARFILDAAGMDTPIRPVDSDHFPQLAPRPGMEAAASEKLDNRLRPWPSALRDYVTECMQRPKLLGYDRKLYE